ncbi:MAG TPA: FmdB family zinc ribbon protein [Armatimonadota bacterium]|nr:FmdB family zinc ribbon protein [Armatimonadota bacterium]
MPIYEYVCSGCGERFELLRQRSQRNRKAKCEQCGCADTELVMSGFFGRSGSGSESQSVGSSCSGCSAKSCSGCRR